MEKGEFVAVRRDTSAKMTLKIDSAVDSVTKLLDDIHDNMYTKYAIILTIKDWRELGCCDLEQLPQSELMKRVGFSANEKRTNCKTA